MSQINTWPVTMTSQCLIKVSELLLEENQPGLALRIYITGGGCSGFQYGFMFDDQTQEEDWEIQMPVDSCTWGSTFSKIAYHYLPNSKNDTLKAYRLPGIKILAKDTWLQSSMSPQTIINHANNPISPQLKKLTVKIDAISMHYLPGASVDYKIDVHGERFVVTNPNASSQCSCGSSFAA